VVAITVTRLLSVRVVDFCLFLQFVAWTTTRLNQRLKVFYGDNEEPEVYSLFIDFIIILRIS